MNSFLTTFVKYDSTYALKNPTTNSDFYNTENVIRFLRKTIFKPEVVRELKTALNFVTSTETFEVKDEVVKKLVVELVNVLVSNEQAQHKTDVFIHVFDVFAETCKEDESTHIMQFFVFLCYVLGVDDLLISEESEENKKNAPYVNDETFKGAFGVKKSSWSSTSLTVFKALLQSLLKHCLSFDTPEMQPYRKWLQHIIRGLTTSSNDQSVVMDINCIALEIDVKVIELNLDYIFSQMIFQPHIKLKSKILLSYSNFVVKCIIVFSGYQKILKFFSRFLPLVKNSPKKLSPQDVFSHEAMKEFKKVLLVMSSQQLLSLLHLFIDHFKDCFNEVLQKECSQLSLEVISGLLISSLGEIKIYASNISNKTLDAFMIELNILKDTLQGFGSQIMSNSQLFLKKEAVVRTYLEIFFYCSEVEILVTYFKSSFPENLLEETNILHHFNSEQWDCLVNNYFNENFQTCHPIFLRMGLQQIRTSKLIGQNRQPSSSTINIIFEKFGSDFENFDLLHYINPEDMILIMEILPVKKSRKLARLFLKHILGVTNEERVVEWLSDPSLLEDYAFIKNLFIALLDKTSSVGKEILSSKNSTMALISGEYFDSSNEIKKEKLAEVTEIVNAFLKENKKISRQIKEKKEFSNFWTRVLKIFKVLPLAYLDKDMRQLGLSFGVELAILTSSVESNFRISVEKLYDFFFLDSQVSLCFDLGLFFKWLSQLYCEDADVQSAKMKLIRKCVEVFSKSEDGIKKMNAVIESRVLIDTENNNKFQALDTRLSLYDFMLNMMQQVSTKKNKRKSNQEVINGYCNKLAKIVNEEIRDLTDTSLNEENYKVFFKGINIQLEKDRNEKTSDLKVLELQNYFDFAVNKLKEEYSEICCRFLLKLLEILPDVRDKIPRDSVFKIWTTLRNYELTNWQIFSFCSVDSEFDSILIDLLNQTKVSLEKNLVSASSNLKILEIWKAFLDLDLESRRNQCQLTLQALFDFIHDFPALVRDMSIEEKRQLIEFFCFCLSNRKVIMTSLMIDTIIDVVVEDTRENSLFANNQDFHDLFVKQAEIGSLILLKYFMWNKGKIHLTFILFKQLMGALTKRSDATLNLSNEDIFFLSACGFSLEKWISQTNKLKKDFARIAPYFIAAVISCLTSVTIVPAVKIHLVNCLNSLLSISDSHTISYLMRAFKPGQQQVFTTVYNQFKKYHKYSGKV